MAKFSLALNFATGADAPYLAKWGCAPLDTLLRVHQSWTRQGQAPTMPSHRDGAPWLGIYPGARLRTVPVAVLAPTTDSRASRWSARLLRCPVGPRPRPIDVLLGGVAPPNPRAGGSPPDPHQLATHRRQLMS